MALEMKTKLFSGLSFFVSRSKISDRIEALIVNNGGYLLSYSPPVANREYYLVSYGGLNTKKEPYCKATTPAWIEACVLGNNLVDVSEWPLLFRPQMWPLQPLHPKKFMVSITGFTGSLRFGIISILAHMGAVYTDNLRAKNTHLICKEPIGQKYTKALEWKVRCVSLDWLYHIIKDGYQEGLEERFLISKASDAKGGCEIREKPTDVGQKHLARDIKQKSTKITPVVAKVIIAPNAQLKRKLDGNNADKPPKKMKPALVTPSERPKRKSTKNPIDYREPNLNAKLCEGDAAFVNKKDLEKLKELGFGEVKARAALARCQVIEDAIEFLRQSLEQAQKKASKKKEAQIAAKPKPIIVGNRYERGDFLGKGGFGTVYSCTSTVSKQKYALKLQPKATARKSMLQREIAINRKMNHPNICRFLRFFSDDTHYFFILELCSTNLRQLIRETKTSEDLAKSLLRQIVGAVAYMHASNVIHRDLKPVNIFLKRTPQLQVKIGDFGISVAGDAPKELRLGCCGTNQYMAPEILRGELHDFKIDIWSIGVISYEIFFGKTPFAASCQDVVSEKVLANEYIIPPTISENARSFIQATMIQDPKMRLSANMAKNHQFISKTLKTVSSIVKTEAKQAKPECKQLCKSPPKPKFAFCGQANVLKTASHLLKPCKPSCSTQPKIQPACKALPKKSDETEPSTTRLPTTQKDKMDRVPEIQLEAKQAKPECKQQDTPSHLLKVTCLQTPPHLLKSCKPSCLAEPKIQSACNARPQNLTKAESSTTRLPTTEKEKIDSAKTLLRPKPEPMQLKTATASVIPGNYRQVPQLPTDKHLLSLLQKSNPEGKVANTKKNPCNLLDRSDSQAKTKVTHTQKDLLPVAKRVHDGLPCEKFNQLKAAGQPAFSVRPKMQSCNMQPQKVHRESGIVTLGQKTWIPPACTKPNFVPCNQIEYVAPRQSVIPMVMPGPRPPQPPRFYDVGPSKGLWEGATAIQQPRWQPPGFLQAAQIMNPAFPPPSFCRPPPTSYTTAHRMQIKGTISKCCSSYCFVTLETLEIVFVHHSDMVDPSVIYEGMKVSVSPQIESAPPGKRFRAAKGVIPL